MARQGVERRLSAILSADVVGYSRLMGVDEAGTLAALNSQREEFINPTIAEHKGRIVKLMGDGALVEFPSAVDAVQCAAAIQDGITARNADVPADKRIEFRIGVNLGDIIVEGDDIYGDGVNVAARLQELCTPGGVAVSAVVFDQVDGKLDLAFDDLGEKRAKNIAKPLRVYSAKLDGAEPASADPPAEPLALPDKPSIAVLPFTNMSGDPEQEYLADGITEDVITALAKNRWFFVIDRNSTFTYKGQTPDTKQVSRELGVRYVLEGSVRRAGKRVRIAAQLVDATAGTHVWAEHYDREIEDIFALQDDMTHTIVGVSNGRLAFQLADGSHTNYVSPRNVADGVFHHVAVTVVRDQPTGGTFYVDGALVSTFNPTDRTGSLDNASDLFIGKRVDDILGVSFVGLIDEVELSNRVLTEAEIQAIFAAGIAGKCKMEQVAIDIKPGNYPNSINLGSGGAIPVAILGSLDLDVSEIDTESLVLGTAGVKTVGKKDHQLCSIEDVSGDFTFGPEGLPDGFDDLVCHFVTLELVPEAGDTIAKLSGNLLPEFGGGTIEGQDSVNIVP